MPQQAENLGARQQIEVARLVHHRLAVIGKGQAPGSFVVPAQRAVHRHHHAMAGT